MKTMSIYEPALCCETGICGVGINPELLRISAVFNNLQKNGITAARFNLNSPPQAFINNTDINRLLKADEPFHSYFAATCWGAEDIRGEKLLEL